MSVIVLEVLPRHYTRCCTALREEGDDVLQARRQSDRYVRGHRTRDNYYYTAVSSFYSSSSPSLSLSSGGIKSTALRGHPVAESTHVKNLLLGLLATHHVSVHGRIKVATNII
jgi:hypothetical protein